MKLCAYCEKLLVRSETIKNANWKAKKYCDAKCRNAATNERHKPKKTAWMREYRLKDSYDGQPTQRLQSYLTKNWRVA